MVEFENAFLFYGLPQKTVRTCICNNMEIFLIGPIQGNEAAAKWLLPHFILLIIPFIEGSVNSSLKG
ncbi:MAG: hypothetical protein JRI61_04315 [Deltaproteobacteria bacterium]|nr:hypothetical protein [Deltaproteobacteria bacterium]